MPSQKLNSRAKELLQPDEKSRGMGIERESCKTKGPTTDSTIALPKKRRFFLTNVSWLLDTRKGAMKKSSSNIFMIAKVYRIYRTMTPGRQWARYFRRCGRELASKPAISLQNSWGGYRSKISISGQGAPSFKNYYYGDPLLTG